jgi:hypothetical protein
MVTSTSVDVSYREVDGWHIFQADQMPGFYVSSRDPLKAYEAVGPTIEKLVKLDTGFDVRVAPEVPFSDFIGAARAAMTVAATRQRFNMFKEAA